MLFSTPMIARTAVLDRLSVLADATRSRLLFVLDGRELTVGELCAVLQLPQSTVSRHLKILADEGWVASRGEGTSRFYAMRPGRLDPAARKLWQVVRDQVAGEVGMAHDARRLESVLAQRRSKSQLFFSTAAGEWDRVRSEMVGQRGDLLALLDLLDERWVVGDLGCGTGHLTAALAPCVARVIAVDESGRMLAAARERLAPFIVPAGGESPPRARSRGAPRAESRGSGHASRGVELRPGRLEALPIDDASLDAAVLFLVVQFLGDPTAAFAEARRVLRPGGKLLVVDLMPHDRVDYALQLGHIWQGFGDEQMRGWLDAVGLEGIRYRALPADPTARGPSLFAASARRRRR